MSIVFSGIFVFR